MDEIRDESKKDQISRFLDNRTLRVQSFGSNVSADRGYRRAERIVAAIHLVTNHVSGSEPARQAARKLGLELLSAVASLRNEMRNSESQALNKTRAVIRTLISHSRILAISGHISIQNAQTLVEALDELANFMLASQRTPLSETVVLTKEDLLDTDSSGARPLSESRSRKVEKPRSRAHVSDNGAQKGQRSERIAGVLTSQGQLAIKDIAASLPEYSEKMIQRELKSLVLAGRVRKSGSKRWSVYAIA